METTHERSFPTVMLSCAQLTITTCLWPDSLNNRTFFSLFWRMEVWGRDASLLGLWREQSPVLWMGGCPLIRSSDGWKTALLSCLLLSRSLSSLRRSALVTSVNLFIAQMLHLQTSPTVDEATWAFGEHSCVCGVFLLCLSSSAWGSHGGKNSFPTISSLPLLSLSFLSVAHQHFSAPWLKPEIESSGLSRLCLLYFLLDIQWLSFHTLKFFCGFLISFCFVCVCVCSVIGDFHVNDCLIRQG